MAALDRRRGVDDPERINHRNRGRIHEVRPLLLSDNLSVNLGRGLKERQRERERQVKSIGMKLGSLQIYLLREN